MTENCYVVKNGEEFCFCVVFDKKGREKTGFRGSSRKPSSKGDVIGQLVGGGWRMESSSEPSAERAT